MRTEMDEELLRRLDEYAQLTVDQWPDPTEQQLAKVAQIIGAAN